MAVLVHDAVDQAAAHDRLGDGGLGAPVGTIREQIIERDGEVVVGVHQPRGRRHDPVPIGVRIGGERDAKAILEPTMRAIAYGLEGSMRIWPS